MLHHPIRSSLIALIAAIAVAVTAAYLIRPSRALADVESDCPLCYAICLTLCEENGGQQFEIGEQTWCLPSCDDATINNQQDFNDWLDDNCSVCPGPGQGNCKQALYSEWGNQCRGYDENPTPIEGPLPPPGDCGERSDTGSTPSSGAPVDLFYGDKVESTIDLRVRLTGLDFSVSREYTSNPEYSSSAWIGNHWTSSLFRFFRLEDDGLGQCSHCWGGFAFGGLCADFVCIPAPFIPVAGPTAQVFVREIVNLSGTDYPVWRLVEPGQWEVDFYRPKGFTEPTATPPPPPLIGRIAAVRDMYGNTWENQYTEIDGFMRLSSIDLNDQFGASQGVVNLTWETDPTSVNKGKLREIVVSRPDATSAPIETQRVVYTYMDDSDATLDNALGTDGDLIQVTRSTRVDPGPGAPGGNPVWRVRITQYRYHGNVGALPGAREFVWKGGANQLKMVISPEQIEYAAQKYNAVNPDLTLEAFADSLLGRADDYPVFTDGDPVLLVDLAAKIVEEYELAPGEQRVETQYVQSACGCGGGSTQGLKLTYDYSGWGSGGGQTTKITEEFKDGAVWTLHRTLHHDTELQPSGPPQHGVDTRAPYLITKAIDDGTRQWVAHYVYDEDDRNLVRMMTPSAKLTYTPAVDPNPPVYNAHSNQGLVYAYAYDTNNYRTEVRLAEGFKDTSETVLDDSLYTLISRTAYGDGTGDTRIYLPNKAEAIRVEGADPDIPGDADKVEVADYVYGFYTTGEDDIAWVETKVETELESENGPDGTYSSYELYDNAGKNYWSIAADGSYTKRVFDVDDINSVSMTGRVIRIIRNADTVIDVFPGSNIPPSLPGDRYADGASLTTDYVRDLLGRVQERVTPGQVSTYTLREMRPYPDRPDLDYYAEVTLLHEFGCPSCAYNGPATITWYNADDDVIGSRDHEIGPGGYTDANDTSGYERIFSDYDLGQDLARSVVEHDVSGLVTAQKAWHSIAGDGAGGGVYTTSYVYDALGRVLTTTNPVNTVTRNTYDVLDRVIQVEVGTDASSPVPVAEYFYDHTGTESSPIQGDDNGNLTLVRQHVDIVGSGTWRVTVNTFDFRDRLVIVKNPIAPHQAIEYDNLDRVIHRGVFSTVPADPYDFSMADASRKRLVRADYSQRGLAYKQSVAINPTSDAGSRTSLETNTWVDEVRRAIETWPPNAPATKTTYDGLGRAVIVYVTDRHDDADPGAANNYANVYDSMGHKVKVDGDVILEQTTYRYVDGSSQGPHSGMLDLLTARLRTHDADDTKTGDLADFTAPNDKLVITTYAGTDYDGADRPIRSINFGTNDDANQQFVYGGAAPLQTIGDWITDQYDLITTTAYNVRGLVDTSTDPENQVTKYVYDDLNRRRAVVENQIDLGDLDIVWDLTNLRWKVTGGLDPGAPDDDRVTSFVYDGTSNVIKQAAHLPGPTPGGEGTVQVTEYVYGVTTGDTPGPSDLASNDLLRQVIYPEESAGNPPVADRTVFSAYNRQGELIYMKDQNATEHAYTRDKLGRVTADDATIPFGSDIDNAIQAISTSYTDYGLVETVKSLDGAALVQNAVEFEYNTLWQITDVWQEPGGNVIKAGQGASLKATNQYAKKQMALGNYSRVDFIKYPDGAGIGSFYGLGGSSDDRISRIVGVRNGASPPDDLFVAYERIGLNMFAVADYIQPDVQLDRTASHTGERQTSGFTDNPGLYPGFDRFGRVARQMWVDGDFTKDVPPTSGHANIPPIVELTYSYDKTSNRTTAYNENPAWDPLPAGDFEYVYDGLDRLGEAKRGSWDPVTSTFSQESASQKWALDMLGNWDSFFTDYNKGSSTYDSEEPRTHNDVNELTDRDPDGILGSNPPLDLTYDKAGNLRTEQVGSGSVTVTYTHDAWNRLVRVKYANRVPGEYEYNGLNWRIIKRGDTDLSRAVDQQRIMYYSANWQLLEERIDDDSPFTPDPLAADIDRHVQHVWGARYIDDVILHREDNNKDGIYDDTWYHLTDVQFSTVAVIDDTAYLFERVTYTAYGEARHHRRADLNGDGDVNAFDLAIIQGNWGFFGRGDLTRDGTVDAFDLGFLLADWGGGLPAGQLSNDIVDNQIGWDGYVFNRETQQYHVRFRCYSPTLGRWLERDAALYVDGANLYQYARTNPITGRDPSGLKCGSGKGDPWVPDDWGIVDFTFCCSKHDFCWSSCKGRKKCDNDFCKCLKDGCKGYRRLSALRITCDFLADMYCKAVKAAGKQIYCKKCKGKDPECNPKKKKPCRPKPPPPGPSYPGPGQPDTPGGPRVAVD